MKVLSVSLTYRKQTGEVRVHEVVEADSLLELVSKFNLQVARIAEKMIKDGQVSTDSEKDDDIPF
jgi:hypothetical protein